MTLALLAVVVTETLVMPTLTNGLDYAVAKGGTLRITGDAVLTGTANHNYMFRKNEGVIDIGGKLIVNTSAGTQSLLYYDAGSTGILRVGGVVNNDTGSAFALCGNHGTPIKWVIGAGGMSSGGGKGFSHYKTSTDNGEVTLKAATNFTMFAAVSSSSSIKFDTSDENGSPCTIKQSARLEGIGTFTIAGTGTFLGNCALNSNWTTSSEVSVVDSATLAVNPGKAVTQGEIAMGKGTTFRVAKSGTVVHNGGLSMQGGSTLAFTFTGEESAPVLKLGSPIEITSVLAEEDE